MYKDINKDIDSSNVVEINNNYKNEYFNSFKFNKSIDYKENKWKNLLSYKFLKGIIRDSKIVSMGYISDIEYNGGNIIIQTIDEYQNKGYATCIVEKISENLLKNMILPIYWIESKNIPSIKSAESLGFKNMVTEIVVSIPVYK